MTSSLDPGIASCIRRPASGGMILSSAPHTTSVGTFNPLQEPFEAPVVHVWLPAEPRRHLTAAYSKLALFRTQLAFEQVSAYPGTLAASWKESFVVSSSPSRKMSATSPSSA